MVNHFLPKKLNILQGRSQPHSPGWARVPLIIFPQILINLSYFSSYEFLGGTQASMSPRRTEWLIGAEKYTHFFHKKINISTTIHSVFSLLSLIERYLSPLFNEEIFRFLKKKFYQFMAFLPKRYPSLYFSLCSLVIFSREYCHKWKKIM